MIQSGAIEVGAGGGGWTLHTGIGPRTFQSEDIKFNPPFTATPKVVVALSSIDCDQSTNLRLNLIAHDVEPDEFSLRITTWDNSMIFSVKVSWIAHDQ